jgi:hypothetical protein
LQKFKIKKRWGCWIAHEDSDMLRNAIVHAQSAAEPVRNPRPHQGFFVAPQPREFGPLQVETLRTALNAAHLPNGNVVLRREEDYREMFCVHNGQTGALLRSFEGDREYADAIAALPNGNFVVGSSDRQQHIRVFNPNDGVLVNRFSQQGEGVVAIVVLANGNIATIGGWGCKQMNIYNPLDGILVKKLEIEKGAINGGSRAILLRDGNIAYIEEFHRGIQIINPQNGNTRRIASDSVLLVSELDGGELAVLTDRPRYILKIYNKDTCELIKEIHNQADNISCLADLTQRCENFLRTQTQQHAETLAQGIAILRNENLLTPVNESTLKYYPEHAPQVATGLVILHRANILSPETRRIIKNYPGHAEFADCVARGLIILKNENLLQEGSRLAYTNARFAEPIAQATALLLKANVDFFSDILKYNLHQGEFALPLARAIIILHRAHLLNTFDEHLVKHTIQYCDVNYVEDIAEGIVALSQANILNRNNIMALTCDPSNILITIEALKQHAGVPGSGLKKL